MPNWVKNIICVSGNEDDINAMMQRISSDETPFDFNNLIPMPEALDVTSGGIRDYAMLYYISDALKLSVPQIKQHRFISTICKYVTVEEQVRRLKDCIDQGRYKHEELWKQGKIYTENLQNYGATDWYDWACNNWGTKWNACEAEVSRVNPSECWIYFDTAWSFPEPIIIKLVSEYPQLKFEGKWADEDMGTNCGSWSVSNGSLDCRTHDEDALRFACDVWGEDYDEVLGWYEE